MYKFSISTLLTVFAFSASSQIGWKKITELDNPIVQMATEGVYKGAAWVDVNNDGLLDLFAMPNYLFINKDKGKFERKLDSGINPSPGQIPGGCSWGDIDNDGDMDVLIAQYPSGVYLNDGTGKFTNISNRFNDFDNYAAWGCSMADTNNDGKLDILFVQANGFHGTAAQYPCRYFLQEDKLQFNLINKYEFTSKLAPYTVPYFSDYDLDGDVDLFIATGPGGSPGPDYHYRNDSNGSTKDTFSRMTTEPWAKQKQDGQCYNFVDYDNDGDLDLSLTNYGGGGAAPSRFFENIGDMKYNSKTYDWTNIIPQLSTCWGDFDNDGDLDLITTSDNQVTKYFRNNGKGTFEYLITGLSTSRGSSGISAGDFDNDGDLDVFVHGLDIAKSLFENQTLTQGNSFAIFDLKGTISNRSAIGAKVKVKADIDGIPTWQLREVSAQNTFQGQNDVRIHFGLKKALKIDSLVLYWPSGLKEFYINVDANKITKIEEGQGELLGTNSEEKEESGFVIFPNPSSNNLLISSNNGKNFNLKIYSASGQMVDNYSAMSNEVLIETTAYRAGLYLILIKMEKHQFWKKFIKK